MTQEEKAKAYDRVLERAWAMREDGYSSDEQKKTVEEFFPQLHESEDERIRKKCMDFIRKWSSKEDRDECLAWLEKQKENYLGKYSEEENLAYRLNWVMQDYYKAGKDDEEREHRFKCYQLFWDSLEDTNFFEQKEQKPAEWSEEDEKMLDVIINYIPDEYIRRWFKSWLKSLRPSWKPSEEQMDKLLRVASTLDAMHYKNESKVLVEFYNNLKS